MSVATTNSDLVTLTLSASHGTFEVQDLDNLTSVVGNNTSQLVLTGTPADINTLLTAFNDPITPTLNAEISTGQFTGPTSSPGLLYTPDGGFFGADTLSATLRDAVDDNVPIASKTLSIIVPTEPAPVVTPSGNPTNYTLGGSPVVINPQLKVSSTNPNFTGAIFTISPGTLQPGDTLAWQPNFPGLTSTYANGVLTISGTQVPEAYDSIVQDVLFSTTSSSTAPRSISIVVLDGPLTSNTATEQISITPAATPVQQPASSSQGGTHGTHSIGSSVSDSALHGDHALGDSAPSSGGSQPGVFNFVPPSQAPVTSDGGTSTTGTSNQTSGTKSFVPVDNFFPAFDPSDLY